MTLQTDGWTDGWGLSQYPCFFFEKRGDKYPYFLVRKRKDNNKKAKQIAPDKQDYPFNTFLIFFLKTYVVMEK